MIRYLNKLADFTYRGEEAKNIDIVDVTYGIVPSKKKSYLVFAWNHLSSPLPLAPRQTAMQSRLLHACMMRNERYRRRRLHQREGGETQT